MTSFSFPEFLKFDEETQLNIKNQIVKLYIFENHSKHDVRIELNISLRCIDSILKLYNIKKSKELQVELRKQTNLKKYGVTAAWNSLQAKEKIKQTNLKKYGVEYPSQCDKIKEKTKQTCLEKYGVEYVTQSKDIQQKMKETSIAHFGENNYNNRLKAANTIKNKSEFEKQQFRNKTKHTWSQKSKETINKISNKAKQTKLERYGDENYRDNEKRKQTCLKKYGVEHHFKSTDVKEKAKQTWINNLGVEHPSQSITYKEKYKSTSLEKYGTEHPFQSDIVKEKIVNTNLERYDRINYNQRHLIPEMINVCSNENEFINFLLAIPFEQRTLSNLHDLTGYSEIQLYRKCINFNCLHITNITNSMYELDFKEWLDKLNISCSINNRKVIYPKEIDIFIPKANIGIEINGIYWHSVQRDASYKLYHQEKSLLAQEKGLFIYHIFEHELIEKVNKKSILDELKYMLTTNNFIPKQLRNLNVKDYPDEIIIDFSKENPKEYEKFGYEIISLSEPIEFSFKRYTLYNSGNYLMKRTSNI